MSVEEKFHAAVKVIKSLPTDGPYQPSNDTKLKFYSLYKQATEGKCCQAKPSLWDIVGKAKWNAWNRLGDMNKTDAMNAYIEELKKIVETMSFNGDVQDFLDSIGPFYEFISLNTPELDGIKETIDRLTSSSSSASSDSPGSVSNHNSFPSSPATSPDSTPAKEPEIRVSPETPVIESAKVNGDAKQGKGKHHTQTNGHIPNTKVQNSAETSPSLQPPPAPTHRATVDGNGEPVSSGFEDYNEVMEIHEDGSVDVRTGRGSRTSESERFYSGESDDEFDGSSYPDGMLKAPEPVAHSSKSMPRSGQAGTVAVRKSRKYRVDKVEFNTETSNDCPTCTAQTKSMESVTILNMTVDRLNRDIEHVLARLRILEAAYASSQTPTNNSTSSQEQMNSKAKRSKPFGELSKTTWIIIFSWPVLVQLIFKFISWYLNRRRNRLPQRPAIGF